MAGGTARFTDRVAIITGSGRGMGRQLALDMAVEGARVVITDIDLPAAESACREVEARGGRCLALPCDVSVAEQVRGVVSTVVERWGTVDILVNNAGVLLVGGIEDLTEEVINRTLDTNVKGSLYFVREVTPIMRKKHYGKIVNVASVTGKNGDRSTLPVYGASKGAIITMTRSIARELGPDNINCNAIAPHAVMTEMMSYWDDERKERARSGIPIGRLGSVEDMSNLMMFLSSDESSFITGETININGGFYMD